jgi:hypothetical protein
MWINPDKRKAVSLRKTTLKDLIEYYFGEKLTQKQIGLNIYE